MFCVHDFWPEHSYTYSDSLCHIYQKKKTAGKIVLVSFRTILFSWWFARTTNCRSYRFLPTSFWNEHAVEKTRWYKMHAVERTVKLRYKFSRCSLAYSIALFQILRCMLVAAIIGLVWPYKPNITSLVSIVPLSRDFGCETNRWIANEFFCCVFFRWAATWLHHIRKHWQ